MILNQIVQYKMALVEREKKTLPLNIIIAELDKADVPRDFKAALLKSSLSIIAEIKKASPSKGIIREDFSPKKIASEYDNSPVDTISVLTEDKYFAGKNEYIEIVKSVTNKPVLRKDFIIDLYQIYQSRYIGADAILIIAALHSKTMIASFLKATKSMGMAAIVEVHTEEELERVIDTGAEIIGINNRNLKTFETTISTTEKMIKKVPKDVVVVSESGIHTHEDMKYLEALGVDAVLIGESIMKSNNIHKKVLELRGEDIA